MNAVDRLWPDSTIVCIGSGPSLLVEDVERCRGQRVVVVNDSVDLAPWADALFSADFRWWERRGPTLHFSGLKFTAHAKVPTKYPDVVQLQIRGRDGFDPRPTHITSGANSGHMAIHLSAHLGARKIVLLGYDMQQADGRNHWHKDHDEQRPMSFRIWKNAMTTLAVELRARGIEVINASRDTALQCYVRQTLEEALS